MARKAFENPEITGVPLELVKGLASHSDGIASKDTIIATQTFGAVYYSTRTINLARNYKKGCNLAFSLPVTMQWHVVQCAVHLSALLNGLKNGLIWISPIFSGMYLKTKHRTAEHYKIPTQTRV